MSTAHTFGELLRHYRKWRDITQQELAERISYTRNMVGRWERGKALPNRDTVRKIANELGLDGNSTNNLLKAAGYAHIALEGDPDAFAEPEPPMNLSFTPQVALGLSEHMLAGEQPSWAYSNTNRSNPRLNMAARPPAEYVQRQDEFGSYCARHLSRPPRFAQNCSW